MANKADPAAAKFREALKDAVPLRDFLSTRPQLTLEQCRQIVDQALLLIEKLYAHLPLKRTTYAVDPVRRLQLLRLRLERRIDQIKTMERSKTASKAEQEELNDDMWFHRELSDTLTSVRDLHTVYHLPEPFNRKVAFLPFHIEEYFEKEGDKQRKFAVTQILPKLKGWSRQPPPDDFKRGVEVTHWNGIPITRAVELAGERNAGSNPDARLARGLARLTFRPLLKSLPPDETSVTLDYLDEHGNKASVTAEWYVATLPPEMDVPPDNSSLQLMGVGLDSETDLVRRCKRRTFGPEAQKLEQWRRREPRAVPDAADARIQGIKPFPSGSEFFQAKTFEFNGHEYGYLRIRSFKTERHKDFLDEFIALVEDLPSAGLIIDVRDNPGGHILNAERLLQVLTPRTIRPELMQFISSDLSLKICSLFPEYLRWEDSIQEAMEIGATYSSSLRHSSLNLCNNRGQRYYGPVVLITNGLSYSATDIFAAGFQDNNIGPVLGTDGSTGGGGANVISLSDLRERFKRVRETYELMRDGFEKIGEAAGSIENDPPEWPLDDKPAARTKDGEPLALSKEPLALPREADLRIAIRRTLRVGKRAGSELEDLGVTPEHRHKMSLRDLLDGNADLMARAAELLQGKPSYCLRANITQNQADSQITIDVTRSENIERLDAFINGQPISPQSMAAGIKWPGGELAKLKLCGYASPKSGQQNGRMEFVAARKFLLKKGSPPTPNDG